MSDGAWTVFKTKKYVLALTTTVAVAATARTRKFGISRINQSNRNGTIHPSIQQDQKTKRLKDIVELGRRDGNHEHCQSHWQFSLLRSVSRSRRHAISYPISLLPAIQSTRKTKKQKEEKEKKETRPTLAKCQPNRCLPSTARSTGCKRKIKPIDRM